MKIAVVGCTGAVGKEILRLLEKRSFPIEEIRLFASERSVGQMEFFLGQTQPIRKIEEGCFDNIDIAFFSAGSSISKKFAPIAKKAGAIVIDNSSAFRMDSRIPLIIPEINPEDLLSHEGIISNPNCATIIMLMALAPLHKHAKIKRVVVSTYQAASGAGALAMQDLIEETRSNLNDEPYTRKAIPYPYAFNLFLHNSKLNSHGYCEEEMKLIFETRKILNDPSIKINATCVRVPVLRSHSEAINVEFHNSISAKTAHKLLIQSRGVRILEDWDSNRFPMPIDATGKDEVLCGRIREDLSQENTLDIWVVADQLLKGAALNAVQIAEEMIQKNLILKK